VHWFFLFGSFAIPISLAKVLSLLVWLIDSVITTEEIFAQVSADWSVVITEALCELVLAD